MSNNRCKHCTHWDATRGISEPRKPASCMAGQAAACPDWTLNPRRCGTCKLWREFTPETIKPCLPTDRGKGFCQWSPPVQADSDVGDRYTMRDRDGTTCPCYDELAAPPTDEVVTITSKEIRDAIGLPFPAGKCHTCGGGGKLVSFGNRPYPCHACAGTGEAADP